MSLFSKAAGLFKRPETADNILDKDNGLLTQVGGWIGNQKYTDEEKAKAENRMIDIVVDFAKSSASENTKRSKSRRALAIGVMQVEIFLVIASVIVWPFDKEYAQFIWSVASSTLMFGAFSAVIIFFFGGYGVKTYLKNKSS